MAMGAVADVTGVVYIIIIYTTLHVPRRARDAIRRTSVIVFVRRDTGGSAVAESENHSYKEKDIPLLIVDLEDHEVDKGSLCTAWSSTGREKACALDV